MERALWFRTLARGFAYPTAGRALEIHEALCALAWTAGADHAGRCLQAARDAWRSVDDARLVADYRRLFDISGPVSLHETAYHGRSMARRAVVLADIDGLYRAFGVTGNGADLADRLDAELDFLSALLLKEHYACAGGLSAQRRIAAAAIRVFLQQHLGRWAEAFAASIAAVDAETPYRVLADLLTIAVARECRRRRVRRAPAVPDVEHEVA